jgi:CRISPR/Cas system-associated endoribonuclease Cas2
MAYLFIFDLRGNGRERRRVDRYLRGTARKIQHSVWEFRNLPDLIGAAELVRKGGGKAMAFSRKDEILLHVFQAEELLKLAAC